MGSCYGFDLIVVGSAGFVLSVFLGFAQLAVKGCESFELEFRVWRAEWRMGRGPAWRYGLGSAP